MRETDPDDLDRESAMPTFIMMTRLNPDKARTPDEIEALERAAMDQVHRECPGVDWVKSYAVLGPFDYFDVFRARDVDTAEKVARLIRQFGHADTAVWPATEWERLKSFIGSLSTAA